MNKRLIFKTAIMVIALVGVIYGMRALQTGSQQENPDSALSILMGSNAKPYNWCGSEPGMTVSVLSRNPEISATKTLNEVDKSRICEVIMEPVAAGEAVEPFIPVAQALKKEGPVTLERNEKGVFRVQGLPFKSKSLTKVLSELQ